MGRAVEAAGHRSVFGEWEMHSASPDVRLRDHVIRYAGFRERAHRPLTRQECPIPAVVVIIAFGPAITVNGSRLTSFTGGLTDTPTLVESLAQHCIQVDLTPLGAFRLLGLPMDTLTGQAVSLESIFGAGVPEITERLYEAGSWAARFELLDAFLLVRLARGPLPAPEVAHAWNLLRSSGGRVAVGRLATETGWSRKHLINRFRAQVGLPPKTVGSIMRFHRAVSLLTAGGELADIAVQCGYYDQSHFNREFRRFTGGSPTAYLARLLPEGTGVAAP